MEAFLELILFLNLTFHFIYFFTCGQIKLDDWKKMKQKNRKVSSLMNLTVVIIVLLFEFLLFQFQ